MAKTIGRPGDMQPPSEPKRHNARNQGNGVVRLPRRSDLSKPFGLISDRGQRQTQRRLPAKGSLFFRIRSLRCRGWPHQCRKTWLLAEPTVFPATARQKSLSIKRGCLANKVIAPGDLKWSRRSESNRRPADYESAALPTELLRLALMILS